MQQNILHRPRSERALASLPGVLVGAAGLLIALPRLNYRTWRTQLVLNETAWLPAVIGVSALMNRRTPPFARALALVGTALSSMPLWQIRRAQRALNESAIDAMGLDDALNLPPTRAVGERTIKVETDVVYKQTTLRDLKLDAYLPVAQSLRQQGHPAVIVLHPGGWYRGDKGGYFARHNRHLARQGFAVFDVQYRFTSIDGARWPSQLEDVQDAIRWVKQHADKYGVDITRVAVLGRSSGGQLALRAAYDLDARGSNSDVQAAISIYAPLDLRFKAWQADERVTALMGGPSYDLPQTYSDASPVDLARDDLPPTLLIHGYMDALVSPLHAELLHSRLKETNTPCLFLRIPWGRHGFDAVAPGMGAQFTWRTIDRFLAWSLNRDGIDG